MKTVVSMLAFALLLNASSTLNHLTLDEAIEILQNQNLEIKTASLDVDAAKSDLESVSAMHWGTLDFTQDAVRSNDAGNVFGFKLSSREANFGDFGFADFNPSLPAATLLKTQPHDLNYPSDSNYFQSKLKYQVPLFTGYAITSYEEIMSSMKKLKTLEKEQVTNEKIYQLKKSYYDMALLQNSMNNIEKILTNITTLEGVTTEMIEEGYAKKIDLLEVQAKKGNVERLLVQMRSNEKLLYQYISFLLNQKVEDITPPNAPLPIPSGDKNSMIQKNLDIQKATTGLEIRKNMVSASEASLYPTVGAFAEVGTADDTFLGDAFDHKAYTVGARLSWNLFDGGTQSAKLEKSKLEHLKMQTQLDLARKGITLQLTKIQTEIQSMDEEILSLEKELLLARAIYENYLGRYKEKLASMSDVIIKQSQEIEKTLQLQMAKNSRNEKILALEKLLNGEQK